LQREFPDAVFVSAVQRETTRPLIERIARELAERWDASARGPAVEPEGAPEPEAPTDGAEDGVLPGQLGSLDDMLRAAGKRVRVRHSA
jgi:GTP-binding protein HflX